MIKSAQVLLLKQLNVQVLYAQLELALVIHAIATQLLDIHAQALNFVLMELTRHGKQELAMIHNALTPLPVLPGRHVTQVLELVTTSAALIFLDALLVYVVVLVNVHHAQLIAMAPLIVRLAPIATPLLVVAMSTNAKEQM